MRYERQLLIPKIGHSGQNVLGKSTVTIIGSGGLGSPVLTYLTCAGVGKIRIVDGEIVSEPDLNREFLHNTHDINNLKVLSAREKLLLLNPEVEIAAINKHIEDDNAKELIAGSDVVVDCVDNMHTRVTVAKACIKLDIPLVEGSVYGFNGFILDTGRDYPCLSCLGYDKMPAKQPVPVLGVTAGVIGCMQANECIKLLLKIGEPLYGRILNYDGLSGEWKEVSIKKSDNCTVHSNLQQL